MKYNKIISLVTIFLFGGIGNSFAGPIEVNITGSVTSITGLDTPPSSVSVGDTVTGTFTYNTDTAPTDSDASAEIGRYKFTNNETFSLTIGSLIWSTTGSLADELQLIMSDNLNNTLDNYSWVAQGNANDEFVSFPEFGGVFYEMFFALTDNVTPFDLLVNDLLHLIQCRTRAPRAVIFFCCHTDPMLLKLLLTPKG